MPKLKPQEVYTCCDQCEKEIYVGEKMWTKGAECYCHSKCLIASFNEKGGESNEQTQKSQAQTQALDASESEVVSTGEVCRSVP